SLLLIAGQDNRFEQAYTNDDIVRLICRQRSLDFDPGTRFSYSSSGYVLLAAVVERVSGMSLQEFARKNLFEPLGMRDTLFDDDFAAVVPNRVTSYRRLPSGRYERYLKHFDLCGDGGLLTTVEDVTRWYRNFETGKVGGKR